MVHPRLCFWCASLGAFRVVVVGGRAHFIVSINHDKESITLITLIKRTNYTRGYMDNNVISVVIRDSNRTEPLSHGLMVYWFKDK